MSLCHKLWVGQRTSFCFLDLTRFFLVWFENLIRMNPFCCFFFFSSLRRSTCDKFNVSGKKKKKQKKDDLPLWLKFASTVSSL